MELGRWAPSRHKVKWHRCQGCAITLGPLHTGELDIAHWNSACKDRGLCHQMLCDLSNFPLFIRTHSTVESSYGEWYYPRRSSSRNSRCTLKRSLSTATLTNNLTKLYYSLNNRRNVQSQMLEQIQSSNSASVIISYSKL